MFHHMRSAKQINKDKRKKTKKWKAAKNNSLNPIIRKKPVPFNKKITRKHQIKGLKELKMITNHKPISRRKLWKKKLIFENKVAQEVPKRKENQIKMTNGIISEWSNDCIYSNRIFSMRKKTEILINR